MFIPPQARVWQLVQCMVIIRCTLSYWSLLSGIMQFIFSKYFYLDTYWLIWPLNLIQWYFSTSFFAHLEITGHLIIMMEKSHTAYSKLDSGSCQQIEITLKVELTDADPEKNFHPFCLKVFWLKMIKILMSFVEITSELPFWKCQALLQDYFIPFFNLGCLVTSFSFRSMSTSVLRIRWFWSEDQAHNRCAWENFLFIECTFA